MRVTRLFIAIVAIAVFALPVMGQTAETGVLRGRVVDVEDEAIRGAVVTASWIDGSHMRWAETDEEGRFQLRFLPPGTYRATVEAAGHASRQITDLEISASRVREIEVALAPSSALEEEITVTAAAPLLDTTTNEQGAVLRAEELELLPTSRTATELVEFAPGVRSDQVWGGSTEQANSYKLDGVAVNHPGFGGDFLLPNVDWIEQVEVLGLGSGAEYGNFQGGLINMVTRSGSNQLDAGLRLNYEDESLNSTNINAFEAGEERDSRMETSVDVGGPLIRDRLYYFVSAQRSELDTRVVDGVTSTLGEVEFLPVQEQREETKLFGKLNWDAGESDRLSFVAGWDDVETDNRGLDSYTSPEAAQFQDSPAYFYNASWQKIVGSNHAFELKFTGFEAEDDRLPLQGQAVPAVQILGGNRDLFANAVYTRDRDLTSNAGNFSWDSFLDLGGTSHQLKAGVEYDRGTWLERRSRNGNLTWRPEEGDGPFDPSDPSTWGFISSDWGGDIRLDAETVNGALYVQDYATVTERLNVSAGLRVGDWEGEITPGFGDRSSFTAMDDTAIAPRVGAIYDVTGDGKLVAKAHWGRYFQNMFALLFDRVAGGNVFRNIEYWDWVGDGLPDPNRTYTEAEREQLFAFYDDVPLGDQVGMVVDYEQPYVDQIVLGVEYLMSARAKIGFNYINRENENIVALRDRNLMSNYTPFHNVEVVDFRANEPVLDQNGNPLVLGTIYLRNDDLLWLGEAPGMTAAEIAALTYDPDFVLTNIPEAERSLDQFQLSYDRQGDGWSLSSSVVWTELEGNFFSVSGYEDPFGSGAGAFIELNEQIRFEGDLRNFSDLEVKLRVSGDLAWGIRGGLFYRWTSGDHYTPRYVIDNRNHDYYTEDGEWIDFNLVAGVSGQEIFLEQRGSRELDEFSRLDLYLDRVFLLGESEIILGVDLFNVFNEDAVTATRTLVNDQDPTDPLTLFGAPLLRQQPRTVRLNATFRF